MSIQKEGKLWIPTCDVCGDTLPGKTTFNTALDSQRHEDWKSRMVGGEWESVCASCLDAEEEGKGDWN